MPVELIHPEVLGQQVSDFTVGGSFTAFLKGESSSIKVYYFWAFICIC